MGRRVAVPEGAEWITLDGCGRFYPVTTVGSVVLVDGYGLVWAELIDTDTSNILFRTLTPMSRTNWRIAFDALVKESGKR